MYDDVRSKTVVNRRRTTTAELVMQCNDNWLTKQQQQLTIIKNSASGGRVDKTGLLEFTPAPNKTMNIT